MTSKPDTVRFAEPSDERAIFEALTEMHREQPIARTILPFHAPSVIAEIKKGTERRNGIIGVIEERGQLVATVGLLVDYWWWTLLSPQPAGFLQQRWLFVRPAARGNPQHQRDLFDFMEHCRSTMAEAMVKAGDHRAFILETSFITMDRIAAREKIWSRVGRKVGGIFMSGLDQDVGG